MGAFRKPDMSTFRLDSDNRFVISNYQEQRPFSSTLPGIAGPMGIPMWVFYVNRGQAITSFGVENKDHPIMEFQPANKAYQLTPYLGFRTFIKVLSPEGPTMYEPFTHSRRSDEQQMLISFSELELIDRHPAAGLQIEVLFFTLPEEPVAGLVRQVKITNLAERPAQLEILDGLPVIITYGVSNQDLKTHHRTVEAWMEVVNLEQDAPFFRLKSTPGDTAEVRPVRAGNFAHAIAEQGGITRQLSAIVEPETVFGQDTSFGRAENFQRRSLAELLQQSRPVGGKTPCVFFGCPAALAAHESITLYSIYGYASNLEVLNQARPRFGAPSYYREKRRMAGQLISELTGPIATRTSSPTFDAYCRQTFLDNVLRGGWPIHLGSAEKPVTYHIYSRKHGDPERDYNAFFLAAEYYSQGNGNYRDINQNRRSEVYFDPRVEDKNIRSFMSLIQPDGYNPLVVKGSLFWIPAEKQAALLSLAAQPEKLQPLLEKPFTPGGLLKYIFENGIELHTSPTDFLNQALRWADQSFDAEFGEGYWIDHWSYNLDMIDSFLAIFPDRAQAVLFDRADLPFFQSPVVVQPRSEKYVLVGDQPRQYKAIARDPELSRLIASRREVPNLARSQGGYGPVFQTTLCAKLVLLALLKFATLDPLGMGVEMEAERPGWCDALNGLPGLFGSAMTETFDLARLLSFLLAHIPKNQDAALNLPVEASELLREVVDRVKASRVSNLDAGEFHYWDVVAAARERYREKTRLGFDGKTVAVPFNELREDLSLFLAKVQGGIDRALRLNDGIPPTYFTYEVDAYDILHGQDGKPAVDSQGRPRIRARRFRQHALPLFLEGAVRMFNTLENPQAASRLHQQVKHSVLYDTALKMYKTNAPLDHQPMEIGRLRAFTPGWLENESIFLHMEYKYLLALLRAGLYTEFFEDFRNALVAFQDPARYGRSPLENSSFIVSSAHPDARLHGAGFVARLTGATAEFLSMWNLMMVGQEPFFMQAGGLYLRFRPALPDWLFDENGRISFSFLGRCQVTYHNPKRQNTFADGTHIQRMTLYTGGVQIEVHGGVIGPPYAAMIRERRVDRIDAFFQE
jgi:hypothetical protein